MSVEPARKGEPANVQVGAVPLATLAGPQGSPRAPV